MLRWVLNKRLSPLTHVILCERANLDNRRRILRDRISGLVILLPCLLSTCFGEARRINPWIFYQATRIRGDLNNFYSSLPRPIPSFLLGRNFEIDLVASFDRYVTAAGI